MSLRPLSPSPYEVKVATADCRDLRQVSPFVSAERSKDTRERREFTPIRLKVGLFFSLIFVSAFLFQANTFANFPSVDETTNVPPSALLSGRKLSQGRFTGTRENAIIQLNPADKRSNTTSISLRSWSNTRIADVRVMPRPLEAQLYDETGCRISMNLKYVDCGFDGHIFASEMDCPRERRRRVILKVKTVGVVNEMEELNGPRMYASYDREEGKRKQELYHQ